jgi:hypothetical protein
VQHHPRCFIAFQGKLALLILSPSWFKGVFLKDGVTFGHANADTSIMGSSTAFLVVSQRWLAHDDSKERQVGV